MTVSMVPDPAASPGLPRHHSDVEHRELRLVRERARTRVRRRRAVAGLAVFGLLSCALLFSVVVAHVTITQNQFRLEQLEARAVEEQAEYERLRLQVAELESPGRVVETAQDRLGMVQPDEVTYLSADPASAGSSRPAREVAEGSADRTGSLAASNPAAGWQVVKPHLGEK